MSTNTHMPIPEILDREGAKADQRAVIDRYSPYLEELVNCSTHLFARCEKSLRGVEGSPSALIHLYYHAIQMSDGIQVLIANACFDHAVPLVRSLWETKISVQYMLNQDFPDRSTAWVVEGFLFKRKYYSKLRELATSREAAEGVFEDDYHVKSGFLVGPDPESVDAAIAAIDEKLSKPKFAPIAAHFRGKDRIRRWHQINGGPRSIEDVAERLNLTSEYEFLYRPDSEVGHARDASRQISVQEGTPVLTPLRPGKAFTVAHCSMATSWLIMLSYSIADKLCPGDEIRELIPQIIRKYRPELFK